MPSHLVIPSNSNGKQLVRHVEVESSKILDNKQYNPLDENPTRFVELGKDVLSMVYAIASNTYCQQIGHSLRWTIDWKNYLEIISHADAHIQLENMMKKGNAEQMEYEEILPSNVDSPSPKGNCE